MPSTDATVHISDVGAGGHDVPVQDRFEPSAAAGVSRYAQELESGRPPLEALLVNQSSETLVVAFHGFTDKRKYTLPRFEWLRTMLRTDYSALFFSDPSLRMHETIALAWYTGWRELDLFPVIAEWTSRAAQAVGASRVIFFGSSGGGFAALQAATQLPGSLALPFNAQTAIANYFQENRNVGTQRRYVQVVMPHLLPPGGMYSITGEEDWSVPIGERASALVRYAQPQPNRVLYGQNMNDLSHVNDHYRPFRDLIESGPNRGSVRFIEYDGPTAHRPPDAGTLLAALAAGDEWLRSA